MTPPHGKTVVEGKDTGWGTVFHDLVERIPVVIWPPVAIHVSEAPVHAPAAADEACRTKEVIEQGP